MFACLYLPPPANGVPRSAEGTGGISVSAEGKGQMVEALVQVARDFSPRVETHGDGTVTLDISGLGSLIGEPRVIGEELRRSAADAGLRVHIAVAATTRAAILLAHGRAGLTVIPRGGEAAALAPLPLSTLLDAGLEPEIDQLRRWGLRTLGDLAALPSPDVSARLGQQGLRWQKWARGEDSRPLVPARVTQSYQESLDLEWPIDELEPLSFVLARLFEPLCHRLERDDRGAVTLHVTLTLVTSASARTATPGSRHSVDERGRELHERVVELPAPMRDARVLRTLALLDLESHPPPAAIDRVAVRVDVAEGRVLQFGLFARALPSDKLATLMARLGALMGSDRVGAPALVDTYRPGAFAMAKFEPAAAPGASDVRPVPVPASVLRRFRLPIPARVTVEQGRPVRVVTDRRGLGGGRVERCDGPWRSSGDWWNYAPYAPHAPRPWDCDEWDVMLSDGAAYRISQSRNDGAWFVEGLID